jgi:hypothetical protein
LIEGNTLDAPTRHRAAHSHAVQHAIETQVIDVERLAGDFLAAFLAGNGFTDEVHLVA